MPRSALDDNVWRGGQELGAVYAAGGEGSGARGEDGP